MVSLQFSELIIREINSSVTTIWPVLCPSRSIWLGCVPARTIRTNVEKALRTGRSVSRLNQGPVPPLPIAICIDGGVQNRISVYKTSLVPVIFFSRGERYCPLLTADNRAGWLCNVSAVIKNVHTYGLSDECVYMCVCERIQTSGLTTYNIIRRARLNGYRPKMGMKLRWPLPRIRSFR